MRRISTLALLAIAACSGAPAGNSDGGGPVADAGPAPTCDSPEDCKVAGFEGVCRQGVCTAQVPCANDLECGLGEDCVDAQCAFTGCITDADCPTGACRTMTYSCAECGTDSDCPVDRPSCQLASQKCVQCASDAQCPEPGPGHCETVAGLCEECLVDDHCPTGLVCHGGVCSGAGAGTACTADLACSAGLTCATVGNATVCLKSCNAYAPDCAMGQICYTLEYTDLASFVFDNGGLLGVCYAPSTGARGYRDSCIKSAATGQSNCQPSLQCVPDSSMGSTCRSYCDPGVANTCPSPELCHSFVGDFNGREYGLCYADNGYGLSCASDAQCRTGESCIPFPDPSSAAEISNLCQFNIGAKPGLAPCGTTTTADGGIVTGDSQCASGACRGDTFPNTPDYFCYEACQTDSDCTVGTRSGTCDQDYEFMTAGLDTFITGCRPDCTSSASCAEYGPQYVCRPRISTSATGGGLKLNCGAPSGVRPAGAPCVSGGDCISGLCQLGDERAIDRRGMCLESCTSSADCTADNDAGLATVAPIDCLPTVFIGYPGDDFIPGTADDQLVVGHVCTGVTCAQDSDCSADGGARCVPEISPVDAGALVLRCRPVTPLGLAEAGASCAMDSDCRSGSCGTLNATFARVCFEPCTTAGSACPGALTCQTGAFTLSSPRGASLLFDGCAP